MLNTHSKPRAWGFSLVELMIGIAIMAILVSIAFPNYQTMLMNSQIRNAAESVIDGIQKARAEAVSRNTNVVFALGTGSSWTVSVVNATTPIESRPSTEGSANVTVTTLAADLTTVATTVTFNSLGGVVPAPPTSLAQVNFTAVGGNKNLRVTIGAGGNARMCDPSLVVGSSSSAC